MKYSAEMSSLDCNSAKFAADRANMETRGQWSYGAAATRTIKAECSKRRHRNEIIARWPIVFLMMWALLFFSTWLLDGIRGTVLTPDPASAHQSHLMLHVAERADAVWHHSVSSSASSDFITQQLSSQRTWTIFAVCSFKVGAQVIQLSVAKVPRN